MCHIRGFFDLNLKQCESTPTSLFVPCYAGLV